MERIRTVDDLNQLCAADKLCRDNGIRALQAARVVHSPPDDLGTLLETGSEMVLQGVFHPSALFEENRMVMEQTEAELKL